MYIEQDAVGISEAAERLGISVEAVRQRIRRGRIKAYKATDGTWRIVLPSPTADQDTVPESKSTANGEVYRELIDHLEEEVSFLRHELEARTEELRRKDHIIAALTQRIPELPPTTEQPKTEPASPPAEQLSPAPPKSRWYRVWDWFRSDNGT